MIPTSLGQLKPRKQPVQVRSLATVDAIFEATVQVLLRDGARKLTTRRIAERAGVSIGTLYQYFPGKEALLYALISRQLDLAASSVEQACRQNHGRPINQCSDAFVNAYIDAKARNPESSRALYHATAGLDMKELIDTAIMRLYRAVHSLLASSPDDMVDDLDTVVFSLIAVVTGGTRQMFEGDDTTKRLPIFREQLARMCRAYLNASKVPEGV